MEEPSDNALLSDGQKPSQNDGSKGVLKSCKNASGQVEKERTYLNEHDTRTKEVNEHIEERNGICSSQSKADLELDDLGVEYYSSFICRSEKKDRAYYILLGTTWVLSLLTRLYAIEQPPKIW